MIVRILYRGIYILLLKIKPVCLHFNIFTYQIRESTKIIAASLTHKPHNDEMPNIYIQYKHVPDCLLVYINQSRFYVHI